MVLMCFYKSIEPVAQALWIINRSTQVFCMKCAIYNKVQTHASFKIAVKCMSLRAAVPQNAVFMLSHVLSEFMSLRQKNFLLVFHDTLCFKLDKNYFSTVYNFLLFYINQEITFRLRFFVPLTCRTLVRCMLEFSMSSYDCSSFSTDLTVLKTVILTCSCDHCKLSKSFNMC